jgi:hypothetical protein
MHRATIEAAGRYIAKHLTAHPVKTVAPLDFVVDMVRLGHDRRWLDYAWNKALEQHFPEEVKP